MPITLNQDYISYYDATESPPGTPANAWVKNLVVKRGYRWAPGDRKDQILPYSGKICRAIRTDSVSSTPTNWWWYYAPGPFAADDPYSGDAAVSRPMSFGVTPWNKAYDRFKEVALGEIATWGTTIAEGREAFSLIGSRALQLARSYRALRKGNFNKFLNELGIRPLRKHRRYTRPKARTQKNIVREISHGASGLWLEYWFGWAPLAGEIYQSTVVLTAENTQGKHWGSAAIKLPEKSTSFNWGAGFDSQKLYTESGVYAVKTGATVRYVNENARLAQQLGLANPLAIAWELVPFSFVVDWFTNVGDMIGSISDLYGVQLIDAYTTDFLRTRCRQRTRVAGNTSDIYSFTTKRVIQRRSQGLISPVLVVPKIANFGHSQTRAATAVSLLVQLFVGK